MTKTELILGVASLVSMSANIVLGWKFGGKQKHKNDNTDAVTRGVKTVTNINERLLDRMDKMINQSDEKNELERQRTESEKNRAELERSHRELCEKALAEHQEQLDILKKEVDELKKNEL